ncbi:hypothetical protein FEE95_20880 [Maribacter algarum]|uniref:Uncharacterized protein n=1 Tax=Maribacter algarum (ex Zhang et al. 2020) TaxID=2578118 RepID=A0A5S3PDY4_9FLAO|nr:hypothetical protein [Maribacter algarum]TMM52145.1 hypothetical protein FEE95_20880 [Maribacter algarum]
MVKKLRTYLKEGFTYSGLEISESEKGEAYYLLELKKSKGELLITNKKELESLDALPSSIQKKYPIFLCINTSDILMKKVDFNNNTNVEAIVYQAFPNIDLNNFYYEVIQKEKSPVVTLSRRESVDSILRQLQELKVKISTFSLGVSALTNVIPYLEEETMIVSNHEINIINKTIESLTLAKAENKRLYKINGLELSSSYLLSFSQILGNLNQSARSTNFIEVTENLKWEFRNFRIFNQVLKFSLVFFIVLLLGNFFAYNSYHEEVGHLNAAMEATSSKKDELTFLDASVKRKQERVETLSKSSNSKATYYLDLFAQRIPTSILLSDIKYQPLAKPVRENKPILLEEGTMLVSGISKDVNAFSFWVEELEKEEWINSVETLDYDYAGKSTSNFLIEIGFHEDR